MEVGFLSGCRAVLDYIYSQFWCICFCTVQTQASQITINSQLIALSPFDGSPTAGSILSVSCSAQSWLKFNSTDFAKIKGAIGLTSKKVVDLACCTRSNIHMLRWDWFYKELRGRNTAKVFRIRALQRLCGIDGSIDGPPIDRTFLDSFYLVSIAAIYYICSAPRLSNVRAVRWTASRKPMRRKGFRKEVLILCQLSGSFPLQFFGLNRTAALFLSSYFPPMFNVYTQLTDWGTMLMHVCLAGLSLIAFKESHQWEQSSVGRLKCAEKRKQLLRPELNLLIWASNLSPTPRNLVGSTLLSLHS